LLVGSSGRSCGLCFPESHFVSFPPFISVYFLPTIFVLKSMLGFMSKHGAAVAYVAHHLLLCCLCQSNYLAVPEQS
jgi:hypothetical protein